MRQFIFTHTNLLIRLLPADRDGLIFFVGTSAKGPGDFVSLQLLDGYVVLVIDLGSGMLRIR